MRHSKALLVIALCAALTLSFIVLSQTAVLAGGADYWQVLGSELDTGAVFNYWGLAAVDGTLYAALGKDYDEIELLRYSGSAWQSIKTLDTDDGYSGI